MGEGYCKFALVPIRHCEERRSNPDCRANGPGLLRCARNDDGWLICEATADAGFFTTENTPRIARLPCGDPAGCCGAGIRGAKNILFGTEPACRFHCRVATESGGRPLRANCLSR